MRPRLQARAVNCIVVEAIPLLERLGGVLLVLLVAPFKHLGCVIDANLLAVHLQDGLRVLQQVVGVDDSDSCAAGPVATDTVAVRSLVESLVDGCGLTCLARTDNVLCQQVVKKPAQLVVACLGGHKIVEARNSVQGRNGAAVIRRNGAAWVADEEGPVEATEHVGGHHSWIFFLLGHLSVAVCWAVDEAVCVGSNIVLAVASRGSCSVCGAVDETICVIRDIALVAICVAVVALEPVRQGVTAQERGCKRNGLSIWREKIVRDVFDEDALALFVSR